MLCAGERKKISGSEKGREILESTGIVSDIQPMQQQGVGSFFEEEEESPCFLAPQNDAAATTAKSSWLFIVHLAREGYSWIRLRSKSWQHPGGDSGNFRTLCDPAADTSSKDILSIGVVYKLTRSRNHENMGRQIYPHTHTDHRGTTVALWGWVSRSKSMVIHDMRRFCVRNSGMFGLSALPLSGTGRR